MKVLYIGVYRDGTGWAQAAIDYILSLDAVGVDVVPRALKLNNYNAPIPDRILELESRSAGGCDYVIQHILPHMMEYDGRFKKNIGLYASETTNFKSSAWANRLNIMDEAWVINDQMKEAALASGVTVPIRIIPHACDIEKFQQGYEPHAFRREFGENDFFFYTIGEFNRRKNFSAMLRAYYTEFEPEEPVHLVIKTSIPGQEKDQASATITKFCQDCKASLKIYQDINHFKTIKLLTSRLNDEGLLRLHNTCDCFISTSHGEAWCIPSFEAMAFGKTPIVTNWSGFRQYMTENTGWLVNYKLEQVFGADGTFDDLYTGREEWAAVDIKHLRKCMREAYENHALRASKSEAGIQQAYSFTHNVVGSLMKESLLDETNSRSSHEQSQTVSTVNER